MISQVGSPDLDDYLEAYEAARAESGHADLADFLPAADDPLYLRVLRELVRVDMEYAWRRGTPRAAAEYVRRFPALAGDPGGLDEITFEEERQRAQAEDHPPAGPAAGWGDEAGPAGFLSRFVAEEAPRL